MDKVPLVLRGVHLVEMPSASTDPSIIFKKKTLSFDDGPQTSRKLFIDGQ